MTTLSINKKKLIRSLARKKVRQETGLFLVEGDKMVKEVVLSAASGSPHFEPEMIVATDDWLAEFGGNIDSGIETLGIKSNELRQVSSLQQPNRALAVVKQMDYQPDISLLQRSLSLALETVQDPGNLGSIIRMGDWFGVRDIICSKDSVDLYNPKVIQSTMGSFLRVRVHYADLPGVIREIRDSGHADAGETRAETGYQVFGTGGQGENIYDVSLPSRGMILLGNESRGLSKELMGLSDRVLSIPHHDPDLHAESLNVANSAAILCVEFRRQTYSK